MKNLVLASFFAVSFVSVACASDETKTEAPAAAATEAPAQPTSAPDAAQQPAEGAKTEAAPESK